MHRPAGDRLWLIYDERICLRLNRAGKIDWVRRVFHAVSRLGDGMFWYGLMIWLLVGYGIGAAGAVMHMLGAGLVSTALYKWLKAKISRPRPYQVNQAIVCSAAPLDQFSFPSGHTLHAVAFSVVLLAHYPGFAWLVLPFSALVALSRMVLGLHYPSDVLAGAALGAAIAALSLSI
ncbi:MAG: phosphatase PAP2 family protein [Burkholderiales bacterium]